MVPLKAIWIAMILCATLIVIFTLTTYNSVFKLKLTFNTDILKQDKLSNESSSAISNLSRQTNNSDIHRLIIQRTTIPPKCPKSSHNILQIEPIDHNWAPFYHRCDYKPQSIHSAFKHPWLDEGFITKEIFYSHVFKAGGTTIYRALNDLVNHGKLKNLTQFQKDLYIVLGGTLGKLSNKNDRGGEYGPNRILNDFMNDDALIFSFVRDPIDRFLSAFYEAHLRLFVTNEIKEYGIPRIREYKNLSGIQIMRAWIDKILQSMGNQTWSLQKNQNKRRKLVVNYINNHLQTNTYFLLGKEFKTDVPFTFIGNLYNYKYDMPQLIEPFLSDEELKRNKTKLMKYLINKARHRSSDNEYIKIPKFSLKKSELSSNDISNLCDIYWMDFLCFPFDIPKECDLNKLFNDHYGNDVIYKDCY